MYKIFYHSQLDFVYIFKSAIWPNTSKFLFCKCKAYFVEVSTRLTLICKASWHRYYACWQLKCTPLISVKPFCAISMMSSGNAFSVVSVFYFYLKPKIAKKLANLEIFLLVCHLGLWQHAELKVGNAKTAQNHQHWCFQLATVVSYR